jgi:hypothetical protein
VDILFLNLKGHHPLNSIKLVLALMITKLACSIKLAPATKKLWRDTNFIGFCQTGK